MDIITAIKSGRPFRRKHWTTCTLTVDGMGVIHSSTGIRYVLSTHDVMATDWEIEEKTVTITSNQLKQAMTKAALQDLYGWPGFQFRVRLLEELGLGPD